MPIPPLHHPRRGLENLVPHLYCLLPHLHHPSAIPHILLRQRLLLQPGLSVENRSVCLAPHPLVIYNNNNASNSENVPLAQVVLL